MPFKSKAQQGYLYAKHPEIAKKFAEETPKSAYKSMPEHKPEPEMMKQKAHESAMKRAMK